MNTPTQSDPVMEMARKIAAALFDISAEEADHYAGVEMNRAYAQRIRDGLDDGCPAVQSALAAIRATTEAAAVLAGKSDRYYRQPTEWDYGASDACVRIGRALRANHHLKGSDDV